MMTIDKFLVESILPVSKAIELVNVLSTGDDGFAYRLFPMTPETAKVQVIDEEGVEIGFL